MSSTFLTGATGYLGSYLAARLVAQGEAIRVLVRAPDDEQARERLWKSLQLHFEFPAFRDHLAERITIVRGELTEPRFGLSRTEFAELASSIDSVVHCAAALNRRSERACLNVNLRGVLHVLELARAAHERRPLRRYSHVSTVSVAGERYQEIVTEDAAIDWNRRDYDAYGRTKKLGEELVARWLPDVPTTIFRPSIVLGDTARPETTQFDMVRAFVFLAGLPALPFRPQARLDIVPVDWVADSIVAIHRKTTPRHREYHLSSGSGSETYRSITDALAATRGQRGPVFLPGLAGIARTTTRGLSRLSGPVGLGARLLDVFYPYLEYDTVFANDRIVEELGRPPSRFSTYCLPLLEFARRTNFRYPAKPWPSERSAHPNSAAQAQGAL